ncbi:MAG: diacylglycerol/polyprenol kinase family protein [Nitrospinota bacterium]
MAVSPSATAFPQGTRIAIHLGFAFVPLYYWGADLSRWALLALCLPAVVGIAFDLYRISAPEVNEFVFSQWGHLLKATERERLTGSSHYFLGILGAVLLYAKPVAVCSSLYMTWADPAALLVGRRVGRRPAGRKTWEGFGAFVAVAFVIGLAFFSWSVALGGAVAAGLIERFTPPWANDNSLIPIGAGFILSLVT